MLAVAGLGLALFLGVLAQYSCTTVVPADAQLPWWFYTILFVVFCAGQSSIWLPMLTCAPLLRMPRQRAAQVAVFLLLFVALTGIYALGLSYAYVDSYGGSWVQNALQQVPGSAQYSFWFTVAAAAVAIGARRLN
jgi:hypothetical protein